MRIHNDVDRSNPPDEDPGLCRYGHAKHWHIASRKLKGTAERAYYWRTHCRTCSNSSSRESAAKRKRVDWVKPFPIRGIAWNRHNYTWRAYICGGTRYGQVETLGNSRSLLVALMLRVRAEHKWLGLGAPMYLRNGEHIDQESRKQRQLEGMEEGIIERDLLFEEALDKVFQRVR